MIEADWVAGLLGGVMIGSAAAIYLLFNGRIMGASTILGEVADGSAGDTLEEKLVFLAGLVGAPALLIAAGMVGAAQTNITSSLPVIIAGGVLVGLGTRLAIGCTSGHGVCGISRLAPRGIAASAVYVGFGMAAMTLLRHGLGLI